MFLEAIDLPLLKLYSTLRSMYGISIYIWFNFMVNVGKYNRPMDPMGMLLLGTASIPKKTTKKTPHLYRQHRRLLFGDRILSDQQGLWQFRDAGRKPSLRRILKAGIFTRKSLESSDFRYFRMPSIPCNLKITYTYELA